MVSKVDKTQLLTSGCLHFQLISFISLPIDGGSSVLLLCLKRDKKINAHAKEHSTRIAAV